MIDAAFALRTGRISQLIGVNDTTWTFIKVEEKKDAYTRPLEEVWHKIEAKLRKQETERLDDEYIARLREEASIDILMTPEDFIFDFEEPLEDTEPQTEE